MTKILCQMSAYHKWVGWDRATVVNFVWGFEVGVLENLCWGTLDLCQEEVKEEKLEVQFRFGKGGVPSREFER